MVLIGSYPYIDDHILACSECSFSESFLHPIKPDFWVSRIDPSLIDHENDHELIRDYFKRNHQYRKSDSNHRFFISSHSYYFDYYNYFVTALITLGRMIPSLAHSSNEFWAKINRTDASVTEIDLHGTCYTLSVNGSAVFASEIMKKSSSKSRFIDLYSCHGGTPNKHNPASAFLFAKQSKVLSVLARTGVNAASSEIRSHSINETHQVVGDIFLSNYSWTNHVLESHKGRILLGDGTLRIEKSADCYEKAVLQLEYCLPEAGANVSLHLDTTSEKTE